MELDSANEDVLRLSVSISAREAELEQKSTVEEELERITKERGELLLLKTKLVDQVSFLPLFSPLSIHHVGILCSSVSIGECERR